MSEDHTHRKKGLMASLRSTFLTGLAVVIPIVLTLWLTWTAVGWIDSWVLPVIPYSYQPETLVKDYFGPDTFVPIRGVGVIGFLIFTVLVGWIAKGVIGRSVIQPAERLVGRMPIIRSIYGGLKQFSETVFSQSGTSFERACLVPFPQAGSWAIGFISTPAKGEIAAKLPGGDGAPDDQILSVFIATGFVPPTGFLIYVPARDVVMLDMTTEDAAKLVISVGLVYPQKDGAPDRLPPPDIN